MLKQRVNPKRMKTNLLSTRSAIKFHTHTHHARTRTHARTHARAHARAETHTKVRRLLARTAFEAITLKFYKAKATPACAWVGAR